MQWYLMSLIWMRQIQKIEMDGNYFKNRVMISIAKRIKASKK